MYSSTTLGLSSSNILPDLERVGRYGGVCKSELGLAPIFHR
jgi:hypothetical protein